MLYKVIYDALAGIDPAELRQELGEACKSESFNLRPCMIAPIAWGNPLQHFHKVAFAMAAWGIRDDADRCAQFYISVTGGLLKLEHSRGRTIRVDFALIMSVCGKELASGPLNFKAITRQIKYMSDPNQFSSESYQPLNRLIERAVDASPPL